MTDFLWLDPFEEHELRKQAERQVLHAREDGRRDVTRFLLEGKDRRMHELLDLAIWNCARRAVNEFVWPLVTHHRAIFEEAERRRNQELELLKLTIRPIMQAVHENTELLLDYSDQPAEGRSLMTVTIQSAQPIKVHCAFVCGDKT